MNSAVMYISDAIRRSRYVLMGVAIVGLFGLNGVFVYYALFQPEVLAAAMRNPVSLVFMLEAFLMVALAAWGIRLVGIERPGWLGFIVLSFAGGLAFSVPAFLLLHLRRDGGAAGGVSRADEPITASIQTKAGGKS